MTTPLRELFPDSNTSSMTSVGFGLDIRNAAGSVVFSTNDITWNQVDMFLVNGGQTVSRNYPILEGREYLATQLLINPPPLDRRAIAHTISRSGNTVTVGGGSEQAYIVVLMR